ncbi:hypothetical protein [Bacillus toyonensis]|uniref:hypothetical protein n=1 Tax=Bacillus toyonensis TaxID=155322 RepID=UPI002E232024|nr:hypothetical protein [Bacillus toyonensis]
MYRYVSDEEKEYIADELIEKFEMKDLVFFTKSAYDFYETFDEFTADAIMATFRKKLEEKYEGKTNDAITIMRRKAKRIEKSIQLISMIRSEIQSSHTMDQDEKEYIDGLFKTLFQEVLINDDKKETFWNK